MIVGSIFFSNIGAGHIPTRILAVFMGVEDSKDIAVRE
tara:strand:+ start:7263 stop:7376 length:114 start_codon:yes stop_codon:yes gene_type:complete